MPVDSTEPTSFRTATSVKVLRGSLASFVGLLLAVAVRFALAVPWSPAGVVLALAALTALLLKVDILWVVIAGAALSLAVM